MIGGNLKRLRTEKGMTQQQLADKVAVTQEMIAHIESGRKVPGVLLAWEIAQALGCTLDSLVMNRE